MYIDDKKKCSNKNEALANWRNSNKERRKNRSQDPFWYAKSEEDIKRMANFPWNDVIGTNIPASTNDVIPAIMVIPYKQLAGSFCENYGDTLTRVSDTYYQYMTQGFTGDVNFEHPDLLMTALAGGSLISVVEEMKRAFGILNYYTDHNEYYARKMFSALGFVYDSFTKSHSKADFVSDLNIRIDQINKLVAIPKGFFATDRWSYLSSWLFSDNSDPEYNTLIAYRCTGHLKYNGTSSLTGTCLEWTDSIGVYNPWTYEEWFDYLDTLIRALTGTDQRNIFGALRRVYSDDKFYKLDHLVESYESEIVRNDIISAAIHNGTYYDHVTTYYDESLVPGAAGFRFDRFESGKGYPVAQTADGKIISHVYACYTGMTNSDSYIDDPRDSCRRLLDMYGHMDTAANILDISAMLTSPTPYVGKNSTTEDLDIDNRNYLGIVARSEVFLTPQLFYNTEQGQFRATSMVSMCSLTEMINEFAGFYKNLAMTFHINSHPFVTLCNEGNASIFLPETNATFLAPICRFGEIDKYTSIAAIDIAKMHARSLSTLFDLPKSDRSVTK